jgi:hypothetical protein
MKNYIITTYIKGKDPEVYERLTRSSAMTVFDTERQFISMIKVPARVDLEVSDTVTRLIKSINN